MGVGTMKGWRYESARHALAAKGVRTGYFMPFVKKIGVPAYDNPKDYGYHKRTVKMHPQSYLDLTKRQSIIEEMERGHFKNADVLKRLTPEEYEGSWDVPDHLVTEEEAKKYPSLEVGKPWKSGWVQQSKLKSIREGHEAGKNLPAPYIVVDEQGNPTDHEGRHRALDAKRHGMEFIPVHIFRKDKSGLKRVGPNRYEYDVEVVDEIPGEFEDTRGKPHESLPEGWFSRKQKVSSEELHRWRKNVNMSPTELESFMKRYGDTAGLSRKEASAQGIKSGRDSARAIIRMKRKPVAEWNDGDIKWMRRQNSFVARMKGAKGPLYDEKGRPTRKLLALKVWGHNPEKST